METVIIFGGTGFIGTHLAQHLLREKLAERIVLADTSSPRDASYAATLQEGHRTLRHAESERVQEIVQRDDPVLCQYGVRQAKVGLDDPRGMVAVGADGNSGGTVTELWVDRAEPMISGLVMACLSTVAERLGVGVTMSTLLP